MQTLSTAGMSALGETFRARRESQGLSLSDVADRIHIRSVYLAAIEAEDWAAIGPQVYARGFVRSYARCLGLDPEAAIAWMTDGRPSGSAVNASVPDAATVRETAAHGEPMLVRGETPRRRLSFGAIAGVVVAFVLVLFVGYEYIEYAHAGPGAATNRAPVEPVVQPAHADGELHAPTVASNPESPTAAKNDARSSGFTVRLRDGSWVRIVVDGKVAMEGMYPKGTEREFSGRSATVRVGNAGGVDVLVDGKDLGPMGGLGDVAERSYQLEAR